MQEQKPNKIQKSSSYEELYGMVPPVNATHISPFPASTQAQLGIQSMMGVPDAPFHRNFAPYTSSSVREPTRQCEFICKKCNLMLYTPQAYGGHTSYHSKANKIFYVARDVAKPSYNGIVIFS
jgi:hypothetical protein